MKETIKEQNFLRSRLGFSLREKPYSCCYMVFPGFILNNLFHKVMWYLLSQYFNIFLSYEKLFLYFSIFYDKLRQIQ